MDSKYGQLFTEDDVRSIVQAAQETGKSVDELLESGEFTFPRDEPQFLILGRDKTAEDTLIDYRGHCVIEGASEEHIAGVGKSIEQFAEFSSKNPERMKVPD